MNKFGWTIAFLCLAFSLFAGNELLNIEISSQVESRIDIKPGEARTIPISISNNLEEDIVLVPKIELPEDAQVILGNGEIELTRGQKDIVLVKFIIPDKTIAGEYDFRFALKKKGESGILAKLERKLAIPEISQVGIECLSENNSILAGDEYMLKFILYNKSNIDNNVNISIDASNFIDIEIDRYNYALSPGEAREITLDIITDKKSRTVKIANVKLIAKIENDKSVANTAIKILPIRNQKASLYRTIPANISLSGSTKMNDDTTYFFNPEFYLNGPIDKKGRINLEMLYKSHRIGRKYGEDAFTENISDDLFAIGNEYRMSLVFDNFNVKVGDYNPQITELFYSQRLRGISGHINIAGFNLTTQYQEPSWSTKDDRYLMGKVGYKKDDFSFDVGYLSVAEDTASDKVIWISSRFQPINGTRVALEYAYNNNITKLPDYNTKAPNALLARLNSKYKMGVVNISYLFAGSDYTDRFHSKGLFRADGNLSISKSIDIKASASNIEYNLAQDTIYDNAYRELRYSGALTIEPMHSNKVEIIVSSRKRTELIDENNQEFDEQTIQFFGKQKLRNLDIDLGFAIGKNKAYEESMPLEKDMQRGKFSINWRYSLANRLQAYLRYYNNDLFYTNHGRCYVSGLIMQFEINNLLYFRPGIDYEANLNENFDSQFSRYIAHSTLSLNIGQKQRLLLDAEYSAENDVENNQIQLALKYIQNFGLPVGFSGKISQVRGEITHQKTNEPVDNVVLILGRYTTISDKNGKYEFNGIPEGQYNLIVKTTRLEKGKIPLQGSSVEIVTKPGEIYEQNITIADAASLSGQITQMKYKNKSLASADTTLVEEGGISGILVEIRQGRKMQRQYTDKDGNFKFDKIQPGTWDIDYYANNLPSKTYLEKEKDTVEAMHNSERTVENRVLPVKKQIKIMQDGRTLKPKRK
ncbi:MAG: hypothetical protein ACLFSQ_09200 [Candidatus Zixiibacteriota bacterium]